MIQVPSKAGRFLARGIADVGAIGVRVFTTHEEPLDERFFARRIAAALALRARVVPPATSGYRLLHGEGDRLPGMVCDRYGQYAVMKLDGDGIEVWSERLSEWLRARSARRASDGLLVRRRRKSTPGRHAGLGSRRLPEQCFIEEHGMQLVVELWRGQKTGLFLDHRESRRRVRDIAAGLRVLNLYGYTGGFSIAAGLGQASHVTTVDVAPGARARRAGLAAERPRRGASRRTV